MTPNMTYGSPMPAESLKVAYTDTAGTTAALPSNTEVVRVIATTDCFIEIGTSPTAVADTGLYLAALVPEYFSCPPSGKVSAIRVTTSGTIYVTPFA